MATNTKAVDLRLNAHFANQSAASLGAVARHGAANWQLYAAAAGSAMAMATSASAGVIYDNTSVTATITNPALPFASAFVGVDLGIGQEFRIEVGQGTTLGVSVAAVGLVNSNGFQFDTSLGFLKKFSSGQAIPTGASVIPPAPPLALQPAGFGWAPSQAGFAGFAFNTPGAGLDYGWVRLEYTEVNGLANSVTAIDWAYDTSGAPVYAAEGAGTPEPSTSALAILAAGAVGIGFLRRRKISQAN